MKPLLNLSPNLDLHEKATSSNCLAADIQPSALAIAEVSTVNISREELPYYMTFSLLRSDEVREDAIAWLWDRLLGFGVTRFVEVRNSLVEKKLFEYITGSAGIPTLRLIDDSARRTVHGLHKMLDSSYLWRLHFILAEYFRDRILFAARDGLASHQCFDNYLHHSRLAGNLSSAIKFVLAPQVLAALHDSGSDWSGSVVFLPLIRNAVAFERSMLGLQRAMLHREAALAAYASNLPRTCLEHVLEARKTAHQAFGSSTRPCLTEHLGILQAHSLRELEGTSVAASAYFELLNPRAAWALSRTEILALALLAVDLSHTDRERALRLSARASRLADQLDSSPLTLVAALARIEVAISCGEPALAAVEASRSLDPKPALPKGPYRRIRELADEVAQIMRRNDSGALHILRTRRHEFRAAATSIAWHQSGASHLGLERAFSLRPSRYHSAHIRFPQFHPERERDEASA